MSFDTTIALEATSRSERGKNAARRLRAQGLIPITVYGGQQDTASSTVGKRELAALLRAYGRNKVFTLNLEGASATVKIADMQLDPIKGSILHLDLRRISLTEKSEFEAPIKIIGEAEGVRLAGGILDLPTHSLELRCLPGDLPQVIEVDVTALGIGDHFRVKDLKLDAEKIEVLADPETVIATVVAPRIEEEPVVAAGETAEPEVIKKGKTDEDK